MTRLPVYAGLFEGTMPDRSPPPWSPGHVNPEFAMGSIFETAFLAKQPERNIFAYPYLVAVICT